MAQDISEPGLPEPGPDTFNFDDYLEGNSTFPTFEHTAYLDQEAGSRLGAVMAELELLVERLEVTEQRISARKHESANSFVDSLLDELMEERDEINGLIKKALDERDALRKQIVDKSITLVFQVKTAEELGTVTRKATRRFHKENPQYKNANEDDLDYLTARSRYTITAQIAHFCISMRVPGRKEPVARPTQEQADNLLLRLISSEMLRLMESVSTGLSAAQDWAGKLDAGFPGGGPDVEDLGLDQVGTEDGESMERASADDADRGED
jgi:hypothetical protein